MAKALETSGLLVATSNAGKVRELSQLLRGLPLRLRLLSDFPDIAEAVEDGATFEENAVSKAVHYSSATGLWTLADDSGLCVEALGGAPGVHSARYCDPGASYEERMARLLEELAATGDAERRARFVCVIALADAAGRVLGTFEGDCAGRIARAPRGTEGFGYDPLFIPDGYAQTFGELPSEIKHTLGHRARALAKASGYLRERLTGD